MKVKNANYMKQEKKNLGSSFIDSSSLNNSDSFILANSKEKLKLSQELAKN